jgi:hypothetical protein
MRSQGVVCLIASAYLSKIKVALMLVTHSPSSQMLVLPASPTPYYIFDHSLVISSVISTAEFFDGYIKTISKTHLYTGKM